MPSEYVKVSSGGSSSVQDFYATTSASSFGSNELRNNNAQPVLRATTATGFVTNIAQAHSVKADPNAFKTVFKEEIRSPLGIQTSQAEKASPYRHVAGFTTVVNSSPVKIKDTLAESNNGRAKSPPRHYLYGIEDHEPLPRENAGHGPEPFSTTTKVSYPAPPPEDTLVKMKNTPAAGMSSSRLNKLNDKTKESGWTDNLIETTRTQTRSPDRDIGKWSSSYQDEVSQNAGKMAPPKANASAFAHGTDSSFVRAGRRVQLGSDRSEYVTSSLSCHNEDALEGHELSKPTRKTSGYAANFKTSGLNIDPMESPSCKWSSSLKNPDQFDAGRHSPTRMAMAQQRAQSSMEPSSTSPNRQNGAVSGFTKAPGAGVNLGSNSPAARASTSAGVVHPSIQKLVAQREGHLGGSNYKIGH